MSYLFIHVTIPYLDITSFRSRSEQFGSLSVLSGSRSLSDWQSDRKNLQLKFYSPNCVSKFFWNNAVYFSIVTVKKYNHYHVFTFIKTKTISIFKVIRQCLRQVLENFENSKKLIFIFYFEYFSQFILMANSHKLTKIVPYCDRFVIVAHWLAVAATLYFNYFDFSNIKDAPWLSLD